jgi:hypothetical protein
VHRELQVLSEIKAISEPCKSQNGGYDSVLMKSFFVLAAQCVGIIAKLGDFCPSR